MSKYDTQHARVPRRRFPEFRDSDGWKPVPLQQLAECITTRNSDESTTRVLTNSAEHGILDQRDYFDKDIATKGNLGSYYVVDHGDYVYNPRISGAAPVGPISRNNMGKGVMSPLYTVFRFRRHDTDFYEHYFKSTSWHTYVRSVSSTGARHDRMSITNAGFMRMPVPDPHPDEQRKIADCLGSLDDLIAAEGRKLAALRDHKKGLMQQLFPREGGTRPRLRFPEFQIAGKWDKCSFESLYDFKPNNTYSRDQLNYDDGTVKNIHYGDIHTRVATHFRITAEVVPFVNAEALPDELNPESLCRPGDVIFADASEDLADVGKCIEIIEVGDERVLSGSHTILARPRSSSIVVGFAGYLFKSRLLRDGIEKEAQGTKVMQISRTRLAKIEVFFPADATEQQRIANCFSSLDALIAAQADKLDALRTHRRGLMQQLFPSPDESSIS